MHKKLLSAFLSVGILTLSVVPAFAESRASSSVTEVTSEARPIISTTLDENSVKIPKDKARIIAIDRVKEYFDIIIDEKKFQTSIELRQNYEMAEVKFWDIGYQWTENEKNCSYTVSVDADNGDIVGFSQWERTFPRNEEAPIAKITREQAKKVADVFAKKIAADEYSQLKYVDDGFYVNRGGLNYAQSYAFRYMRIIDGIELRGNSMYIEVDGADSKVISFRKTWIKHPKIPDLRNVIDPKKALEEFKKGIKVNLTYMPNWSGIGNAEMTVKLGYLPEAFGAGLIDAVNGKFIDWEQKLAAEQKIKDLSKEEKEEFLKKAKVAVKPDKDIDGDKAALIMKAIVKEIYGQDYDIESISYSDRIRIGAEKEKIWSAQFAKKISSGYSEDRGYIEINAATGKLMNLEKYYYVSDAAESFQPALTWDEAYTKAIDQMAKLFPEAIKEIDTKQKYSESIEYHNDVKITGRRLDFNFSRILNGIVDPVSGISITFDASTGSIINIRYSWEESSRYPQPDGIISNEEAFIKFFKNHEPRLLYVIGPKDLGDGKTEAEIRAVYKLSVKGAAYDEDYGMASVDAFTGNLMNTAGEQIKNEKNSYDAFEESIKNHWAKDKFSILAAGGILDTKTFKIDEGITKMEAIKILVNAKGYNSYSTQEMDELRFTDIKKDDPDYGYIQTAVKYGMIENTEEAFRGDEKFTRLQMAELIVKQTPYKKLAEKGELFEVPFTDCKGVSSQKLGYIAAAKGLNICGGNNGKFRPQDNATMGEFALAVYNYLEHGRN